MEPRSPDRPAPPKSNVVPFLRPADPSIERLLALFVADQLERLKPRTHGRYTEVVESLERYLDQEAAELLDPQRHRFLQRHLDASEARRSYCQVFGVAELLASLEPFLRAQHDLLSHFPEDHLRSIGAVVRRLAGWLEGHVTLERGARATLERAAVAARDLSRAARAKSLLLAEAACSDDIAGTLDDASVVSGDFRVVAVEPGCVWLTRPEGDRALGAVAVPKGVTRLLDEGWSLSGTLGRIDGRWHLFALSTVLPR